MILLPTFPDLRVTGISVPDPELVTKDGHATAVFPAGLVVDMAYGPYQVRVSIAQSAKSIGCLSIRDDLDATYLLPDLTDAETRYQFGRIAAATAGLLTIPVGSLVALTGQQSNDLLDVLEDIVADVASSARLEVVA